MVSTEAPAEASILPDGARPKQIFRLHRRFWSNYRSRQTGAQQLLLPGADLRGVNLMLLRQSASVLSPRIACTAILALKAGEWLRRDRFMVTAPFVARIEQLIHLSPCPKNRGQLSESVSDLAEIRLSFDPSSANNTVM
jgi:hypothetical protein